MINKVILLGRLGRDPELKYTNNQKPLCVMSVATDNGKDKAPDWHNVIAFDKLAENCAQYLTKGRQVYIEGSIKTQTYKKDGEKRYRTKIVAYQIKFIGSKDENATQQQTNNNNRASANSAQHYDGTAELPYGDDDIPF